MPGPSPFRRRRALRGSAALGAVALAAVVALSGCQRPAAGEASSSTSPPASSAPGAHAAGPGAASAASALDALLDRRESAILGSGSEQDFSATVAAPGSSPGAAQLSAFRSARDLRLSRIDHGTVPPVEDPVAGVLVRLTYRVAGVDRADRTVTVRYRLSRTGGAWRIVAEEPAGAGAAAPWLAMPRMRVHRGAHAVVAGTAASGDLAEAAATVDRVLPSLAAEWSAAPRRVLVLLPGSAAEADALLGRRTPGVGEVAATTEGPLGTDGLATGDQVVVDPDARAALTPTGREVVLAHELTHVAVRATVPGTAPAWLAEGYADHVGYGRAGLPHRELAAPLLRAVRAGAAPTDLPTAADLDPSTRDIEVGYLAAWQAVELLVDERGEAVVRELVRACSSTGGRRQAEEACDLALPGVTGLTRAELTRVWRQRLAALAR